jgi:hypothetical protein
VLNTAIFNFVWIDVSSFDAQHPNSVAQVQAALRANLPKTPVDCGTQPRTTPCSWLLAFGYDPSRAVDADNNYSFPPLLATDLDAVSTTVPIFVLNQSNHIGYANHLAFTLAGITNADCGKIIGAGGQYICQNGQLTGQINEPPAFPALLRLANIPPAQIEAGLPKVLSCWAKTGVTTAGDLVTGGTLPCDSHGNCPEMDLLFGLTHDPARPSPVRIRSYLDAQQFCSSQDISACNADLIPVRPFQGDDLLRWVGIKFYGDGSTQGFSAFLNEPYLPQFCTPANGCTSAVGTPDYTSCDQLHSAMRPFYEKGWSFAIHSNGDATTDRALCAYDRILGGQPADPSQFRMRLEHLTVNNLEQVARLKALGISPSMTLGHVYYWGSTFYNNILGPSRAEHIDPAGWLKVNGMRFSFHSDSPVTPVNPLRVIQTAVTRQPQLSPPTVLGSGQRIMIDDALKAVTLDAAWQMFSDREIGSLDVGKYADLVELNRNPRQTNPSEIVDIRVIRTYLAGVPHEIPADLQCPSETFTPQ